MKATRVTRALALTAATALALTGLATVAVAPADAAAKSTLIIGDGLGWSSLNTGNPDENSAVNADVAYLTSQGFWYYDAAPKLQRNTYLGNYDIVKGTKDFEVKYTIKPGQVWSDGTPIDAVDLLLSHVITSSAYSKKAGLGDPSSDAGGAFYSGGYGGSYDHSIVGLPTLSADHMSVTLHYSKFQPDWEVQGPGPAPVHTLEAMADGKTALQSAAANKTYKAKFLSDFTGAYNGDKAAQTRLAKIGKIWTNDYNFDSASYDSATKPILAVSNGAYLLKSYNNSTQTVTLTENPKYNSGHPLGKVNPVKTIVFKYVQDGTPSVQALQNGDINLYQGAPGAAGYSTLQSLAANKSVGLLGGTSGTYEHIDLRTGNGAGTKDDYTGPFAEKNGQKGKDLRLAFLLAFPRYATMSNQLKPFNKNATLLNSNFTLPGSVYYNAVTAKNGITGTQSVTIDGTRYTYNLNVPSDVIQSANEAVALKLVQKWYPNASANNTVVKINLLRSGRQMRVENNAVIVQHEARAGFAVSNATTSNWSSRLSENQFDAEEFAWVLNSVTQDGSNANYLSDGANNHMGWNDPAIDTVLHKLENKASQTQISDLMGQAEKLITQNAWTLPIYQWPQVTAYSKNLVGVKATSISPTYAWNYWEWHF
jgi:peptide/nickel transport system substrate-binding protein